MTLAEADDDVLVVDLEMVGAWSSSSRLASNAAKSSALALDCKEEEEAPW